jgi:hypothetical protein
VVNTWQQLSDGPLLNTFGAIRSYSGLNSNPNLGQFVDALKTTIINAFALRCLFGTGCENGSVSVLDNLASGASSPNPSTSHGKETLNVPESFHVAQQVQKDMGAAVNAGDLEVFPVVLIMKCLFGTNLSAQWVEHDSQRTSSLSLNSTTAGWYTVCFQTPYRHLTDFVTSPSNKAQDNCEGYM